MRNVLAAFAAAVTTLAVAGMVQAATFEPAKSKIIMYYGSIIAADINALDHGGGGTVTLVDNGSNGHDIVLEASVWATVNQSGGTALYTGVPFIDDIRNTIVNQGTTLTSGFTDLNYLVNQPHPVIGPYLGGIASLSGSTVLWALGVPAVSYNLTPMAGPAGGTAANTFLGLSIKATYQPWVTGPVPVTGVTTNVITYNGQTGAAVTMRLTVLEQPRKTVSTGGGFVSIGGGLPLEAHTLTLSGTNNLLSVRGRDIGDHPRHTVHGPVLRTRAGNHAATGDRCRRHARRRPQSAPQVELTVHRARVQRPPRPGVAVPFA